MSSLNSRESKVQKEYGAQLKKYMKAFKLVPNDIAYLTKSNPTNIGKLWKG